MYDSRKHPEILEAEREAKRIREEEKKRKIEEMGERSKSLSHPQTVEYAKRKKTIQILTNTQLPEPKL